MRLLPSPAVCVALLESCRPFEWFAFVNAIQGYVEQVQKTSILSFWYAYPVPMRAEDKGPGDVVSKQCAVKNVHLRMTYSTYGVVLAVLEERLIQETTSALPEDTQPEEFCYVGNRRNQEACFAATGS